MEIRRSNPDYLIPDVVIPAGLYAVLGRYLGVAADSNFLVALLVVMGFSVHDTIVVFDRVRENLVKYRGREDFGSIVNRSINETIQAFGQHLFHSHFSLTCYILIRAPKFEIFRSDYSWSVRPLVHTLQF